MAKFQTLALLYWPRYCSVKLYGKILDWDVPVKTHITQLLWSYYYFFTFGVYRNNTIHTTHSPQFLIYSPKFEHLISPTLYSAFNSTKPCNPIAANLPIFVGLISYCSLTHHSPLTQIGVGLNHSDLYVKNKLTWNRACLKHEWRNVTIIGLPKKCLG